MSATNRESTGCLDSKTVGICLLLIVNVLWVLSSELTRVISLQFQLNNYLIFFPVYIRRRRVPEAILHCICKIMHINNLYDTIFIL